MSTEQARAATTLNTIRALASDEYKTVMPLVDSTTDIRVFSAPLVIPSDEYEPIVNEFCNVLINRICLTVIEDKMYNGHYSRLKKGYVAPLGTDIQHTYTNPINPTSYNGKNLSGILSFYDNDTKAVYYRRNRQDVFPISINREQLAGAFVSWITFNSFVSNLINAVYSGDAIREENLFKSAIVGAVEKNYLVERIINYPTEKNSKDIVREIKTVVSQMSFASSNFNKYNQLVTNSKPVVTWTPKEKLVILMRSDILQALSVEVLASAFNITEVEFRKNLIEVDSFSFDEYNLETREITGRHNSNIGFVIADISTFQYYDNLKRSASDFIASSLTYQYFLHVWQTYGICPFANCVVYTVSDNTTLLGIEVDKTTVELTNADNSDVISYNIIPEDTTADMSLELLSATKDGTAITDISNILTAEISTTAKTITFDTVTGIATGSYEIKYVFKPVNSVFPNVVISVGITIS